MFAGGGVVMCRVVRCVVMGGSCERSGCLEEIITAGPLCRLVEACGSRVFYSDVYSGQCVGSACSR